MATTCCMCGKKLSAFDDKLPYDGAREPGAVICSGRNLNLEYVDKGRPFGIQNVERFSATLDAFKVAIAHSGPDYRNTKSDMLIRIRDICGGHNTYLQYQEALRAQYFPKECSHYFGAVFIVNQESKQFATVEKSGVLGTIHNFDELIDYNVTENGNSITSGSAGAAAVGALLAGAAGAVVGSSISKQTRSQVSQLDIVLSFKGLDAPLEAIKLIEEPIEKSSKLYQDRAQLCNQIVSALKQILESNEKAEVEPTRERGARAIYAFSVADEIMKFKQLADEGVITSEEFETQKAKLLSLDY